jgi:polyisoprenoid-binding protein YceI
MTTRKVILAAALSAALGGLSACGGAEEETVQAPMHEGAETIIVEAEELGPDRLLPQPDGEDAWIVDRDDSQIMFTGRQADDSFTGRFGEFDAQIVFDPDDLANASIVGAVDLGSAGGGTNEMNESLPEADWFDINVHPRATFTSSEVRRRDDGLYEAVGTFALKGVEKEIVMPFSLEIEGDRAVANATMDLDRSDYGVGQGDFASGEWVALEVGVAIHLEADRAGASAGPAGAVQ